MSKSINRRYIISNKVGGERIFFFFSYYRSVSTDNSFLKEEQCHMLPYVSSLQYDLHVGTRVMKHLACDVTLGM